MALRDLINKHSRLVGVLAVVAAVAVLAASLSNSRRSSLSGLITKAFYSDDDGKSYFADDLNKAVPFDHNGKQAFRAYVFRCGSGGPFVGYLGRNGGTEVKKPGNTKWVPLTGAAGDAVTNVTCPEGHGGTAEAVLP